MSNPLTWYEFFAGGGMARIGLGKAWECLLSNDACPKKASAYKACFPGDDRLKVVKIEELGPQDLPEKAVLSWASFPCQDLSLAGNGKGLEGARSGTYGAFWNLMKSLDAQDRMPGIIVLENVVGTITSRKGQDFASILQNYADSGYLAGAMVINAAEFLPQSRPRLFIIGVREDKTTRDSVRDLTRDIPDPSRHPGNLLRAYESLGPSLRKSWIWWSLPKPSTARRTLADIVEDEPEGAVWHSTQETAKLLGLMSDRHLRKVQDAQASRKKIVGTIYKRARPDTITGGKSQRAEVRFDGIAGCLRTPAGGSSRQIIIVAEGGTIRTRLLSPREAARLMGVPESYPVPPKCNDAYRLFGDGLAVPVVSHLEKHLLRPLALRQSAA